MLAIVAPNRFEVHDCAQTVAGGIDLETAARGILVCATRRIPFSFLLSRIRSMYTGISIECEQAEIQIDLGQASSVRLRSKMGVALDIPSPNNPAEALGRAYYQQLADFIERVRNADYTFTNDEVGLPTSDFIDQCSSVARAATMKG